MERRRENSKRRGVSRCCRVLGGIKGPERGTMRDVGRCFGLKRKMLVRNDVEGICARHRFVDLRFCFPCALCSAGRTYHPG